MSEKKTFSITVPKLGSAAAVQLHLKAGEVRFVVGPNGSGKSSLMHHIMASVPESDAVRVHAQRSVRLTHDKVALTLEQYENERKTTFSQDRKPRSRYFDPRIDQRLTELLFKLHQADVVRDQEISRLVSAQLLEEARSYDQKNPKTLQTANSILTEGSLTFEVKNKGGEFLASHDLSNWFSIQRLSDGERAALLLIAEVLLAEPFKLVLIDEPERHLERSISAPLLTSLLAHRSDCSFVVSTHDIELVSAMPTHQVLLIRRVLIENEEIQSWDFDALASAVDIPEDTRRHILGGRRVIVFTEGAPETLDQPLYSALFPNVSVRAVGSSTDVEHAVDGIRTAAHFHWLEAYGIVDRDQKVEEGADLEKLEERGVYALPVHSVEALYYGQLARERVATFQCAIDGKNVDAVLREIKEACLENLRDPQRLLNLASYRIIGRMRGDLLQHLPSRREIVAGAAVPVSVTVDPKIDDEVAQLTSLVDAGELDTIIQQYKIRESGVRGIIAERLFCSTQRRYEALVIHLLKQEQAFRDAMIASFGSLAAKLSNN